MKHQGDSGHPRLRLRARGLEWKAIEGEVVVLDLDQSAYLAVNRTGAVLWEAIAAADGATPSDLAARLVRRYGVTPETAESDVRTFISTLASRRLLET